MDMDKNKDQAPGVRTVRNRPGSGTLEVSFASGGMVSAAPGSLSSNDTRPCPPCTAGEGSTGIASAMVPEG